MAGLTDRSIRSLKPSEKPRRAYDAGGLYLEITPQGGRYWRLKYRYGGTEKRLALGVYPDVSLAEARHKRDLTRASLGGAKLAESQTRGRVVMGKKLLLSVGLLLLSGQAAAQTATDVVCTRCVNNSDLGSNSVSTDKINNGAVTGPDLAANSVTSLKIKNGNVTSAKLAADAVTGEKVLDNSLTGDDINEYSLQSVRTSVGGSVSSAVLTLPACSNGLRYMGIQLIGSGAGQVLLNASFTAGTSTNFAAPFGIAARVERESPTVLIGEWQESHFGSGGAGRSNIAVTQVFPYEDGGGTYVLRVCDASDSAGGVTIRGQLNYTYTPSPVPGT